MPLSVNNLSGFGIGSLFGDPISLSYLSTVTSSTNGTTFTFSSQSIGSPSDNRYIFLVVNVLFVSTGGSIQSTSSVGGNSVTVVRSTPLAGSENGRTGILMVKVTSGSTADIVINTSQSASAVSVSIYTAYAEYINGYSSYTENSANPLSGEMEVPLGGVTLGGSMSLSTTDGITWSNITEDVDGSWATENRNYSSASLSYNGTTTVTPQVSNAGSATDQTLVLVSFYSLPVAGDVPVVEVTAVENDNTSNQTSYTFTAVAFNNPSPPSGSLVGRRILVFACGKDTTSGTGFSSCTIGGNSATLLNQTNTTSTISMCMSTFYITLESGDTADIVVNVNSSTVDAVGIIVCVVHGGGSSPHASNFTAVNNLTSINPSLTPTVPCTVISVVITSGVVINSHSATTMDVNLNGGLASGIQTSVGRLVRTSSTVNETIAIASASDAVAGLVAWAR